MNFPPIIRVRAGQPAIGEKTDAARRSMPLYRLMLHNDAVNLIVYVVMTIQDVLGMDEGRATSITLTAHTRGVAELVVEPLDLAEHHAEQFRLAGLTVTIEPA